MNGSSPSNKPRMKKLTWLPPIYRFSSRLDNYTGADIEAICRESALIAMRAGKRTVSKKFFEQAIDRVRPTVTPEMMEYYGRMESTLTSGLESVKRSSNNSSGMESV